MPVPLTAFSQVAAVQQTLDSGVQGTTLLAWRHPPVQPPAPFVGRTVFMFRNDLFDDVAALASVSPPVQSPCLGSGEGDGLGSSKDGDAGTREEGEVDISGLKFLGSTRSSQ